MPETKKILVIRTDNSGCQPPFADLVSLPADAVDGDPSGGKAMSRLEAAVAEYLKENPDWKEDPTWNDFFSIPDEWLEARGIKVEPIDVPVTLEVGMDEEIDLPAGP